MNSRGLTPIIGLVLLLGITAIASMGLFVVGVSLADTTQSSAEHEQAEQSMAQLAESGNGIAAGESRRSSFSIEGSTEGQLRADSSLGTINITVTNRSTNTQLLSMERSFGAVIYEASDGTEIAYQGGGVWRQDPDGGSSLVRSPEFHYREDPDPTITFPVVLVRDDFSTSGSTVGEMVAHTSERHYPDRPSHYNPLQDGSVLITIDSEYCQGWEQYFEERTDGSAAEDCDDGEEGELVIQFSVPFDLGSLENGVMIGGGNGRTNDFDGIDNSSDFGNSDEAPSATPLVEAYLEDARNNGEILPADTEIDAGLYYDDGNLSNGNLDFNTTGGDIIIATEQSPSFDEGADYDIIGNNNVTVYSTGDLVGNGGGGGQLGEPGKEDQLRIFFHSDVDQIGHKGQNTDVHALIYAPNAEVLLGRGNDHSLSGALVAEDYDFGTKFDVVPQLMNISIYEQLGDAPFYYLHISETEIHVERD
ncbi:hypothetical protein L593_15160 [Salinarchaeum sp. Harcht-Bsk1]|uniref:DUF7289 family protein n=1 Tax=Salinarchaeum sp. Harcht-Bsk1 TaxID=1333523 RepID=UPI0003423649|nr:hypothetical protein [Salinarchaeum sp. Harcht-Bsk1]AGN02966.1 hypothetical protein L593_15160 [Salinarchaeum sp. Harcht-Bsk1]